ncbi:hypothetical protein GH733_017843 [Mirounga leonina]|nr:hypothetical protein GH733_017843 [Mirounga leonina]
MTLACHQAMGVDLANGMEGMWHDESHLNRYLLDHKPTKVLSPEDLWDLQLLGWPWRTCGTLSCWAVPQRTYGTRICWAAPKLRFGLCPTITRTPRTHEELAPEDLGPAGPEAAGLAPIIPWVMKKLRFVAVPKNQQDVWNS